MRCGSLYLWCWCILGSVAGQLKPVEQSGNDYNYLLEMISTFILKNPYNHFIIFGRNLEEEKGARIIISLHQQIMKIFERPVIIAGPETGSLNNLITYHNLAVMFFHKIDDAVLNKIQHFFPRHIKVSIIFIYTSDDELPPSAKVIEYLFNWCWKNHLYYVLLTFKRNDAQETWTYEVKSTIHIFKITKKVVENFKNSKFGLMNLHRSTVAVFQSLPYIFVYNSTDQQDLTGGDISLGGEFGIMIGEFMRFVNGTMKIHLTDKACLEVSECLDNSTIDIGANLLHNTSLSLYSPIVKSTKYCLVLPYKRRLQCENYLFYFYGSWSIIVLFVFYFLVNLVVKRLNNPRMSLALLIFGAFEISMALSISRKIVNRMGMPEKIMMVSSGLYTLLLGSIFCSAITMSVTTGMYMPDIVDRESFLESDLRIMASNPQTSYILSLPFDLSNSIFYVDQNTRDEHLNSLNQSYAYIIESHNWQQYDFLQKRLQQPKLKLSPNNLYSVDHYLTLLVRPELPLTSKLEQFISHASETGLNKKWMLLGLQQMKESKLIVQPAYEPNIFVPLPLEFFINVFRIYVFGLILSTIAIFFECIYWRMHCGNYNNVIIV